MPWPTRISILVLFVVAASAFWWLDTSREPDRAAAPSAAAAQLPDYFLDDFRISRYAAAGPPQQVLVGERLDHYPITRTAVIGRPRVTHQPGNADPWHIRGEQGTLFEEADRVELHGDVRLHRPAGERTRAFSLRTERLDYAMQTEIARTDRPIEMRSPGTRVDAVGMTARLTVGEVDLLDDVRVLHDPALTDGDSVDD